MVSYISEGNPVNCAKKNSAICVSSPGAVGKYCVGHTGVQVQIILSSARQKEVKK